MEAPVNGFLLRGARDTMEGYWRKYGQGRG